MPALCAIPLALAVLNLVHSVRLALGPARRGEQPGYPLLAHVPVTGALASAGASLLSAAHASSEAFAPGSVLLAWTLVLALPGLHLALLATAARLGGMGPSRPFEAAPRGPGQRVFDLRR
jgi:hypothetical protein